MVVGQLVQNGDADFLKKIIVADAAEIVSGGGQDSLAVDRHHVGQLTRVEGRCARSTGCP
jgi:hypothetical protein